MSTGESSDATVQGMARLGPVQNDGDSDQISANIGQSEPRRTNSRARWLSRITAF